MSELVRRLLGGGLIYVATGIRFYFQARTAHRKIEHVQHLPVARGAATLSSYAWFAFLIVAPIPFGVPVDTLDLPAPLRDGLAIAGAAILALSVWLFYACHRALGEFWYGEPGLKTDHQLIRLGPYRYIRHPMYTSFFVGYVGALLLLQSWPFLIPIAFGPGFYFMARVEEEILGKQFPEAYADYRRTAGRFLPRLGALLGRA